MSKPEPFFRLQNDLAVVRTPVEEVMARGRQIRRRRKALGGTAVVSAAAAAAGLVLGLGPFGSSHDRTQIAASPVPSTSTPISLTKPAAVPGAAGCSSNGSAPITGAGPAISGSAALQGLQVVETRGSTGTDCAIPPVALLFSAPQSATPGAVALWGPGATLNPASGGTPSSTQVHGQNANLLVSGTRSQLSWQESNGSKWVLSNTTLSADRLVQFANGLIFGEAGRASAPSAAGFGLTVAVPQIFPAEGVQSTTWVTQFAGAGRSLTVTTTDNGSRPVGQVYLALQAGSGSTPIEVRGHEGVALSAGGRTSLIWPETPTRTIILDGTYTVDEIVAIANGLEFGS